MAKRQFDILATFNRNKILRFCRFHSIPFDWLPNGCMLIVAGRENRVIKQEADGSLVKYTDLWNISGEAWNEIVVDGRGNAYINGGSGVIALVKGDGSVRQVAGDIAFPNGTAITPDNKTLIIGESYGRKLTAFDINVGGSLSNRRVWADLGTGVPDGIPPSGAGWTKLRKLRESEPGRYCRSHLLHQAPGGREFRLQSDPLNHRLTKAPKRTSRKSVRRGRQR